MAKTATIPAADRKVSAGDNNPPKTLEEEQREKHPRLFERQAAWLKDAAKIGKKPPVTAEDCARYNKHVRDGLDLLNDIDSVRKAEIKPFYDPYTALNTLFNQGLRDSLKPTVDALTSTAAKRLLAITREQQAKEQEAADRIREQARQQEEKAAEAEAKGDTRLADVHAAGAEATERAAERVENFATADVSEASKAISTATGVKASVSAKMVCVSVNKQTLEWAKIAPFLKPDVLVKAVNDYLAMNAGDTVAGAVMEEAVKGRVTR